MNQVSANTSGIITATARMSARWMATPEMVNTVVVLVDQVGDAVRRAAAPEQADVLQDEREADRGDQRRQLGRVAQRPVGDPLDQDVQAAADRPSRRSASRPGPTTSPSAPVASPSPIAPHRPTAVNEPIMNTSPWAKLISSMIP